MSKLLLLIFALFAISMAKVGNNGQITLNYIKGTGYVVPVDFSKNAIYSNYMLLSLHTSHVLLSAGCFQFDPYYCQQYPHCSQNRRTFNYNYPTFNAQGVLLGTQIYLDYNTWHLQRGAVALYSNLCQAPLTERWGQYAQGIIGLGKEGSAHGNFKNTASFSIFFNQQFRLMFNVSPNPPANFRLNQIAKVQTDYNWKVLNVQAIAFRDPRNPNNPLRNPLTGVSAILDINSDAIGLPLPIYSAVIGAMANYGVQCAQNSYYQPMCTSTQPIQNLPNFEVQSGQNIIITPQMYAVNIRGNYFNLNFKATAPTLTGHNYVTQEYQYTIILGNTVMGSYYTHFNLLDNSVTFYQAI